MATLGDDQPGAGNAVSGRAGGLRYLGALIQPDHADVCSACNAHLTQRSRPQACLLPTDRIGWQLSRNCRVSARLVVIEAGRYLAWLRRESGSRRSYLFHDREHVRLRCPRSCGHLPSNSRPLTLFSQRATPSPGGSASFARLRHTCRGIPYEPDQIFMAKQVHGCIQVSDIDRCRDRGGHRLRRQRRGRRRGRGKVTGRTRQQSPGRQSRNRRMVDRIR